MSCSDSINKQILKLQMIFDQSESNINAWKTEMHMYEKGKRTKKPFGKVVSQVQHVTHEQIKAKQCTFNPILQNYQRQEDESQAMYATEAKRAKSLMNHLKQTVKYQKNFDIINLKSNEPYTQKVGNRKMGPVRNAFNVINNQKLPQFYFQNRDIRIPVERQKKLLQQHTKQYDILTNIYKQEHQKKVHQEKSKEVQQIQNKYWKTHNYDPVYGKFYDKQKEEAYQKQRMQQEKNHGADAESKLPPSYIYREPFIADYTKPLPESLKWLDERNNQAKKRYQLKYVVLDQYQKRNEEEDIKQEHVVKNHVHFGRVLDEKAKEFNIVTNIPYKETRAEELYGKKLQVESWDKLLRQASKAPPLKSTIKTAGFS